MIRRLPIVAKNLVLVACLVVIIALDASAFDGKRKGFTLGFGVGAGAANIEKISSYREYKDSIYGICTDLTLGWGVSDKVIIHYAGRQQFFFDENGWFVGFPGLGISFFVEQQAPSVLIMVGAGGFAGVGIESVGLGSAHSVGGVGPYFGIGYEWSRHFAAEFVVGGSLEAIREAFETDHQIYWFSLSVHYLGY